MDPTTLLADRVRQIDASGIRRVFALGATLDDPINLSIGQPDFPVPEPMKAAAIAAIQNDHNGYTQSPGDAALNARIKAHLKSDLGWDVNSGEGSPTSFVTSGTSGGLLLAFMAIMQPGDEAIIPDPYFAMYPHLATMTGSTAVRCDTYPDFRMTAERIEPLITDKTKIVLLNSPSNPCGVVLNEDEVRDIGEMCKSRGVLLISDEIYDEFTFSEARNQKSHDGTQLCCPSPCRFEGAEEYTLLIRGFGKTYGCTGWRLGYAAGPSWLMHEMIKLQQNTFVCAPAPLQAGAAASFDVDPEPLVASYETRRDLILNTLGALTEIAMPSGAFYAFIKVPEHLGLTGTQFVDKCIERKLLVIPGGVFSSRDTHFRMSYASPEAKIRAGLDILTEMFSR